MSYRDFAKQAVPIKHPIVPPHLKPKVLKWKVGAKFKRPIDHLLGGQVLTVSRVTEGAVCAEEDGLYASISQCELVG